MAIAMLVKPVAAVAPCRTNNVLHQLQSSSCTFLPLQPARHSSLVSKRLVARAAMNSTGFWTPEAVVPNYDVWSIRTQCRCFHLLVDRKLSIDRGPKSNSISPAVYKGSSRFLQLGANIGPEFCGLSCNRSILHRAPEFGKHGQNYKSLRCMGGNGDDRSSEEESPCPVLQTKHKIFLSHSGKQKEFVKDLCEDLEARFRFPFFDIHPPSLPKGEPFPKYLFQAARQCKMAVIVVSDDYFTSPWPMIELKTFVQAKLRSNQELKILPLFFGLSISEFKDPLRRKRWFNVWQGWAEEDDRINPMDYHSALKEMGLFNGFEFCQNAKELRTFRRLVVSSICNDISPDIKWNDLHVQGRSNICEVVREKIQGVQSKNYKTRIIGFYGMGGIGKTTMCKILCNELSEFDGKVCHVELGANQSFEGLLKKVLKNFTDVNESLLQQLEEGECKYILSDEMSFQLKTFLAIDNVWDDSKSIEQAKMFLEAPFREGSVVLVTARSQQTLKYLGIDECFEVPLLGKDDARNLFLYHAVKRKEFVKNDDNHIIEACVQCCYFQKSEKQGYHYLPLALKILGLHLGCISKIPTNWMKSLSKVRDFNFLYEEKNPLFGVIRLNYDRLRVQEQSLFMDVALYWPRRHYLNDDTVRENYQDIIGLVDWLSLVHNQKVEDTQIQLMRLKAKGLLEDVDLYSQEVSIHDLYRQFAELESQGKLNFAKDAQLFINRRWVYENSYPSDLEVVPSGRCWENLIRVGVALPHWSRLEISSLDRIQWTFCANVVVLMLVGLVGLKGVLNLKGLACLRSLELGDLDGLDGLEGLEELKSLIYLRWLGGAFQENLNVGTHMGQLPASLQILQVTSNVVHVGGFVFARCTNLRHLKLHEIGAIHGELDFSQCTSLRHVELQSIKGLKRLTLGRRLVSLQSLDISLCHDFSDVVGLGDLVGLQHLQLDDNRGLGNLCDLQNLTSLQVLRIARSRMIGQVRGLGSLLQLRELKCQMLDISQLPDLSRLVLLQTLELIDCSKLISLDGVIHDLPALRRLDLCGCTSLVRFPNLSRLTKLEELILGGKMVMPQEKDIYVLAELTTLRLIKIVDDESFNLFVKTLADERFDQVRQKLLGCLYNGGGLTMKSETKYDIAPFRLYQVPETTQTLSGWGFKPMLNFEEYRQISAQPAQAYENLSWTISDVHILRMKRRLKEQDGLIELITSMHAMHSPFQVMEKVERWVREHIADPKRSTLTRLIPHIDVRFHTPLPLVRALYEYDEFALLSRRKYVPPNFNEVRHILNIAQVHAIAEKLSLITFNAGRTIYADGHYIKSDNKMIGHIIKLMRQGIQVSIVTAAAYPGNATKFESRLTNLLEAFKELPPHIRRLFHVMGGECNYLLRVNSDFRLEFIPDELWKSPDMLTWSESNVTVFLDNAERLLKDAAARLRIQIVIVRNPWAVGAVPREPTIYEVLEEMALTVQVQLMQSDLPFCAFNSGNDVFVDVGNKSIGLRALMKYLNAKCSETLHVGNSFTKSGNDLATRSQCSTLWVTNPEETAFFAHLLLYDIHLAKLKQYIE